MSYRPSKISIKHFVMFNFFYSYILLQRISKDSIHIRDSKTMHNFPPHPSYVPTLTHEKLYCHKCVWLWKEPVQIDRLFFKLQRFVKWVIFAKTKRHVLLRQSSNITWSTLSLVQQRIASSMKFSFCIIKRHSWSCGYVTVQTWIPLTIAIWGWIQKLVQNSDDL